MHNFSHLRLNLTKLIKLVSALEIIIFSVSVKREQCVKGEKRQCERARINRSKRSDQLKRVLSDDIAASNFDVLPSICLDLANDLANFAGMRTLPGRFLLGG